NFGVLRPLLRVVGRIFNGRGRGRENIFQAGNAEEFVRLYDGLDNPVGKCFTFREIKVLFGAFEIKSFRLSYFPSRFLGFRIPTAVKHFLDRRFGLMVYFSGRKKDLRPGEHSAFAWPAGTSGDVLEYYSAYASTWDTRFPEGISTSIFHRQRLDSMLKAACLNPEETAFELGAGTGAYLRRISGKVRKITCIDGSQAMLDILSARNKDLKNISTVCLDLEQPVPAITERADLLYCFGLFEHIIDTDTFLENCRKLLKPGGRFVVVTPNARCPWYSTFRALCGRGGHCRSDRYYTEEQLTAVFSMHGFLKHSAFYWGFHPAGVSDRMCRILSTAGRIIAHTPLIRYAGGLTVCYVLEE
ncbi:MAG: class I SAM-dependent methyltransferase, partial [Candidatus Wallbacteria bacterium]|nr:class I SAM-dependent methyltransferase [Candidatus Wallbacteria bacterium]